MNGLYPLEGVVVNLDRMPGKQNSVSTVFLPFLTALSVRNLHKSDKVYALAQSQCRKALAERTRRALCEN